MIPIKPLDPRAQGQGDRADQILGLIRLRDHQIAAAAGRLHIPAKFRDPDRNLAIRAVGMNPRVQLAHELFQALGSALGSIRMQRKRIHIIQGALLEQILKIGKRGRDRRDADDGQVRALFFQRHVAVFQHLEIIMRPIRLHGPATEGPVVFIPYLHCPQLVAVMSEHLVPITAVGIASLVGKRRVAKTRHSRGAVIVAIPEGQREQGLQMQGIRLPEVALELRLHRVGALFPLHAVPIQFVANMFYARHGDQRHHVHIPPLGKVGHHPERRGGDVREIKRRQDRQRGFAAGVAGLQGHLEIADAVHRRLDKRGLVPNGRDALPKRTAGEIANRPSHR